MNSAAHFEAKHLGVCDYLETAERMKLFTEQRGESTVDEIWFLQHPPVFTQGQAGKAEHLIAPGNIPVIKTSRGGQVTYHGPGQLVIYPLLDLRRRGLGVRQLVTRLEQSMVESLAHYGIEAHAKADAPGVYVTQVFDQGPETRKIGSVGLRVSRGCSYHGISLNVAMDLEPFTRINPCGYSGLKMTQIQEFVDEIELEQVARQMEIALRSQLA